MEGKSSSPKINHIPLDITNHDVLLRFETQKQQVVGAFPQDVEDEGGVYAEWGRDGFLPTRWREAFEKSTTAAAAIQKKIEIIYGEGMGYYRVKYDKDGNEVRDYSRDKRIDEFFRNIRVEDFIVARLKDFFYYGNIWAECIKSEVGNDIASIRHLDSEFCRFHRRDKKDGIIKHVGYSAFFSQNTQPASENVIDIPLAPTHNFEEWYKEFKGNKFIIHSSLFSPGHTYYQMPPWAGLMRKEGWLEVSNSIPEILLPLHQNQVKIRYLFKVANEYWNFWYKDWDAFDETQRKIAIKEKTDELNKKLVTPNRLNIYSLLTTVFANPVTQKLVSGIEIEAIDDKIKEDAYIPNSQAADSQIAIALGMDPSELGLQPEGGKMGAGSGSDKRTARTNFVTSSKIYRDIIFAPLYTKALIAGWGEDLRFDFRYILPTSLNENKEGIKEF